MVTILKTNVQNITKSTKELNDTVKEKSYAHNTPPSWVSYDKTVEEISKECLKTKICAKKVITIIRISNQNEVFKNCSQQDVNGYTVIPKKGKDINILLLHLLQYIHFINNFVYLHWSLNLISSYSGLLN